MRFMTQDELEELAIFVRFWNFLKKHKLSGASKAKFEWIPEDLEMWQSLPVLERYTPGDVAFSNN